MFRLAELQEHWALGQLSHTALLAEVCLAISFNASAFDLNMNSGSQPCTRVVQWQQRQPFSPCPSFLRALSLLAFTEGFLRAAGGASGMVACSRLLKS